MTLNSKRLQWAVKKSLKLHEHTVILPDYSLLETSLE